MIGTYVDLAEPQPAFSVVKDGEYLRNKRWPCKVVAEGSFYLQLTGDTRPYWRKDRFIPHKPVYWVDHSGHDRWRFINNKMEWSRNGELWELLNITPEQVDSWSSVQRYIPDLYTDIVIKPPTYAEINSSVLRGSQIRQDNYVVTIQMPSAAAARALINFLESVK